MVLNQIVIRALTCAVEHTRSNATRVSAPCTSHRALALIVTMIGARPSVRTVRLKPAPDARQNAHHAKLICVVTATHDSVHCVNPTSVLCAHMSRTAPWSNVPTVAIWCVRRVTSRTAVNH